MNKLEVVTVTKRIKKRDILCDINLSLEKGKIYGLVGANGSGKTMMIRLLAGLIGPTCGEFVIDGIHKKHMNQYRIGKGVLIENISLYNDRSGLENLTYLASVKKKISHESIEEYMGIMGLNVNDKRSMSKYSLGMKQKIAFIQAIMEHEELILLDEPTNALDADSIGAARKLIMEAAEGGAIVVLASHNEEDIRSCCSEIIYMESGRICNIRRL